MSELNASEMQTDHAQDTKQELVIHFTSSIKYSQRHCRKSSRSFRRPRSSQPPVMRRGNFLGTLGLVVIGVTMGQIAVVIPLGHSFVADECCRGTPVDE